MYVSILAVRAYIELAEERGISRDEFLRAAGIDASRLDDIYGRLELAELDRVQETAISLTGDPALGLHMTERASAPAYDVIGYLVSHATTLRECFENLCRYGRVLSDVRTTIEERGDEAIVTWRFPKSGSSDAMRLRAEQVALGYVRILRNFCGEDTMPRAVSFEHSAPSYQDEYRRLFRGVEQFEQPVAALRFDRALLDRETVHKNPRLKSILSAEADRLMARLERETTLAEKLQEWLSMRRSTGTPTMTEAAKHLGVSVRSLRRRLADENLSYPQLVDKAQAERAKRLLEDANRTIYEVAFEMGFSDPSAFHRAFRRWTGMTPMRYRDGLP